MRPVEFLLIAIFAAVMNIANPDVLLTVSGYGFVLLGLIASYRTFEREKALSKAGQATP